MRGSRRRRIREPERDHTLSVMLGCLGALVVLVELPLLGLQLYYGRAVKRELRAIAARGEPVTLEQARPKGVPAALNAALDYEWLMAATPDLTAARTLSGADLWNQWRDLMATNDLKILQDLARWLDDPTVQQRFRQWEAAAAKPFCQFPEAVPPSTPHHYIPSQPYLSRLRGICRTCSIAAQVSMRRGDAEAAGRYLHLGLRIAAHEGQEPSVLAQLVTTAMRAIMIKGVWLTMQTGDLPPETSRPLEVELSRVNVRAELRRALVAGRPQHTAALGDPRAYTMWSGSPPLTYRLQIALDTPQTVFWSLAGHVPPYRLRQQLLAVRHDTDLIRQADLPLLSSPNPRTLLDPTASSLDASVILVHMGRTLGKRDQSEAQVRLCRVALRLNDYHYQHHRYPPSLADLPQPLPLDPFTNKPFIYRRQGSAYLLYSVSGNRRDDGGTHSWELDRCDLVWGR